MFQHFGWKLRTQCKIFIVLGVNRVQISIFHILAQKTHPCMILHLLSHQASKSVQGLFSTLVREKNSHKKVIFHPFALKERIFTKFGVHVHLLDLINPDKLCVNLFKAFDFTRARNFHSSHRKVTSSVITVMRYRAACDTFHYVSVHIRLIVKKLILI